MNQDLYNFHLPSELIAQSPARPRDSARLLVYRLSDGSLSDSVFNQIDQYLNPKTTLAVNDSKVENCRWLFDNEKTELFVIEKTDNNTIRAMVRPGRKFKIGSVVRLTDWLSVTTTSIDEAGIRTLQLSVSHNDSRLKEFEHIPLPPYIQQNDKLASEYQTIYAEPMGSLAAPTAGLHFTPTLLRRLGGLHQIARITLHVGLGTFAKLTSQNLSSGTLHEETYYLKESAARTLDEATHLTAVGTTSIRALESVIRDHGCFKQVSGSTDIFIRPGFKFKAVDSLVTNFHLPSTSLLMLVAAFIADKRGLSEAEAANELMRIYNYAIENKYRFYSFGDAMLIV